MSKTWCLSSRKQTEKAVTAVGAARDSRGAGWAAPGFRRGLCMMREAWDEIEPSLPASLRVCKSLKCQVQRLAFQNRER